MRALLFVLLLTACTTQETAPSTVSKAVYMPCDVKVPDRPVFPGDTLTGDEDIFTIGKTLWADRKARKAYELKVETALNGCVKK